MFSFTFNTGTDLSAYAPEPETFVEPSEPADENSDGFTLVDTTYWEDITNDILKSEASGLTEETSPHPDTEWFHYGGADDDTFYGNEAIVKYYGWGGIDTVDYSKAGSAVGVSLKLCLGLVGDAAGDTYDSIENVVGSDFDDVLVGSDYLIGNTIDGGNGRDIIFGEGGHDLIRGGNGHDDMYGGQGIDTFEWTEYGGNFVGADRIHDFEMDELLRFRVDNPDIITWTETEIEYQGATGLLIEVIEDYDNGSPPAIRYDVFLDDVTATEFGQDNIEFF